MTTSEQENVSSATPETGQAYAEAAPTDRIEGQIASTTSVDASIPLANVVFASSAAEERQVKVEPGRIQRTLESLAKNRELQRKGLG